jgi:outer membrane protein OmpA-like peptidoglycan-associated protein
MKVSAKTTTAIFVGLCCLPVLCSSPVLTTPIRAQEQPTSSITELPLPRVADYWVSATRQAGGAIIFDGYAPDEKMKTKLSGHPNANTQWLRLGSGAPAAYGEAVDFGLSILDHLSEGRFALRDNVVTLRGTAQTEEDFLSITTSLAKETPAGLVLAQAEIQAPTAANYQWRAQKNVDGTIALSGMVPNPRVEKVLLASAGTSAKADLTFSSGNPDDFQSSAQIGINLLQRLNEGQVSFDGKAWLLSGTAKSPADKELVETDFSRQQLAASGWSMAVAAPQQAGATVASVVEPDYAFSAVKPDQGTIIFGGQLPAEPALRFFGALTGGSIDAVKIAEGAPSDFIMRAEAGVRALMLLDEGKLNFAQGTWSLSGSAPDEQARSAVMAALGNEAQDSWQTDITLIAQAAPAAPTRPEPVASEPAAVQGTTATATACDAPLAEFSARNAIRFRSGAAVITPESAPALDELASDLAACPTAPVHVEGHTDADGDEQLNLALSVARAEAVVNALIERGVAPARLYALGYGETTPIGDNATAEGKELNRRIVVKIGSKL